MKRRVAIVDDGYNQTVTGNVSMTVTCSASDFHHVPCVIAFAQNTREEVRDLGNVAGCVSAESGSHQTTYVAVSKRGLCDAD